ncbi:MAG: tRNA (pseudouridine(54)-N(1))-methyltransferase TrmY [Candidatus Aenigmarchaeota archaeon]|nr:tRNA (pseudouridine(54)-N(1))-methyltransferase TrmY [Candidatus Aenigmarchaeota archaeon]
MMREFIMRARKAHTKPDVNLNELPQQGKMDSVCAAIAGALWISGDVRRDTAIHVVLEGPGNAPKTISFYGSEIRGLRHDERSMASYIADALKKGAWLELNEEAKVRTGIRVAKKSFERLVWEKKGKKMFVLDKDGRDIRDAEIPADCVIIFGSAEGLPAKTEKLFRDLRAEKISLGPTMLFAAHCPVIVNNEMDRRKP